MELTDDERKLLEECTDLAEGRQVTEGRWKRAQPGPDRQSRQDRLLLLAKRGLLIPQGALGRSDYYRISLSGVTALEEDQCR